MAFSISCPSCGKTFRNIKPELAGKKAKCKCGATVRLKAPEPKREPIVSVRVQESSTSAPSAFEDFGDLDDILNGVGDVAPLHVSPKPPQVASNRPIRPSSAVQPASVTADPKPDNEENRSRPKVGAGQIIMGLIAGTIAIWYGIFVVVSRFNSIDQFLLATLSTQLRNAYTATFGLYDVPQHIQTSYSILGWTLFAIGLILVLVGIAQVINSFFQVLLQRGLIPWIDGIGSILALASFSIFVAYVMLHSSYVDQLIEALPKVEEIVMEDAPEWAKNQDANPDLTALGKLKSTFNTSMIVGACVCLTMCILSTIRTFKNFTNRAI